MEQVIERVLNSMQLSFIKKSEDQIQSHFFYMDLKSTSIRVAISVNYEIMESLVFFTIPTGIKNSSLTNISELFHRINFDDLKGAFVIDHNELIMGYHTGFYFYELNADEFKLQLDYYLTHAYQHVEYYLDAILECNFGEHSPSYILNKLELNTDPNLN